MKKLLALTSLLLLLSACEMTPVYDYYFSINNYTSQTVFAQFEFDDKSFSDTLGPYNGNIPQALSRGVNLYEDLDLKLWIAYTRVLLQLLTQIRLLNLMT